MSAPKHAEFITKTGCRVSIYSSEWFPGGWVLALRMAKPTDIGEGIVDARHVEVLLNEDEVSLLAEIAAAVLESDVDRD